MVAILLAVLLTLAPATFTLEAPGAKAVEWAGDVTGWSKPKPMVKQGDTWSISFDLHESARTEYKFVVDGVWKLDPKNPKRGPNGLGGENSVWEGPAYRRRAKDHEPATPMVRSVLEVATREVVVYVPPGTHKNLPVLIYADGREYEQLARAPQIVQNLIAAHAIRPVVLVLVPPIDRMREYWRDSEPTSRFLVEEVLPAVRRRAPVSKAAKDVFLGGASLGGLISLRTAAAYPEAVAGGVHLQSGAFQVASMDAEVKRLAKGLRLFLDWGTFEPEIRTANLALVKQLAAQKQPHATLETPEGHNYTAWRERLEAGLVFLLGT